MGWSIRFGEHDLGNWFKEGREAAIGHLLDCVMVTPDGVARSWRDIPGYFDFQDLYREAVSWAPEGATLVELGCWQGRSARFMAEEIARSRKRLRFDVYDDFSYPVATLKQTRINMGPFLPYANIEQMDAPEAAELYADGSVHFAFLDDDHDRAIRTIRAWWPKIAEGGVLAGHDVAHAGVEPALLEFFGTIPRASKSSWAMAKLPGGKPHLVGAGLR